MKNDYLYSLQSGAKINISDGSCPERIVTVTGHTDSIYKAFKLICNKFEEVSLTQNKNPPLEKQLPIYDLVGKLDINSY